MIDRALPGLPTFFAVAELQSFAAAAVRLGISASAVSQSVRALEARLGTALFVRTTRRVRLTEAGERLYATAGQAWRELEESLAAVRGGESAGGAVRLTVPRISVPGVVAPALARLRERYPALHAEVSVDDRLVDIVEEGFDAGIRLGEMVAREMVAVRISEPFRFVIVGTPAYLRRAGVPRRPSDLLSHQCVGYRGQSTGELYRWDLERRGRMVQVQTSGALITNDAAMMIHAAMAGIGLAYVDEISIAPQLRAGTLRVVLESYASSTPGYFLYFPRRAREQAKVRALIEVMKV